MLKRSFMLILAAAVVFLLAGLSWWNNQPNHKMKLEATLGTALFNIQSHYSFILDSPTGEEPGEDRTMEVSDRITEMKAFANMADRMAGSRLLHPIAQDLDGFFKQLRESYLTRGELTAAESAQYHALMVEIEKLPALIWEVYFVPESHEGSQATLNIDNPEAVERFVDLLDTIRNLVR